MSLLFDQFGVRRVELEVSMWPGLSHGFRKGELSSLYGALNSDDLFESCELKANVGAEFESDHWHYDISTTRIVVASEAFQSFEELDKRVLHLLVETKKFLTPRRVPFLISDRALVRGVVPQSEGDTSVPDVLQAKLIARRLTKSHEGSSFLDRLPGDLAGVGLEIVGDTETYHWHAKIGPTHAESYVLPLSAQLYFPPPPEPPEDEMISDSLKTAYEFVTNYVLDFAREALS